MTIQTSIRNDFRSLLVQHATIAKHARRFGSNPVPPRANITDDQHDLFNYTSGRWIYNEEKRLSERRLPFHTTELVKAAAASVGKSEADVARLAKVAEGGFNRVFEIGMRDGTSVLARLPYPSTVPRRWAVASEVATLEFVRAWGVPTPRVFGYAIGENPVGAEYILMEKLPGRPISDAWFEVSEEQRLQVLHDVVKLEARLFSIPLPASGSIFYARDLDPDTPKVRISGLEDQFCMGPYTGLRWWFGQRGELELDRGPHVDTIRVLQAPAEKELQWIREYGQPRYPFHRQHREALQYEKQDPSVHAVSLQKYLQVAQHLIPTDPELKLPVIRHPDLQPNNIFISEDHRVTGLIDWQHTVALPAFLAAGIPNAFQNHNDAESSFFTPPHLPADIDSLAEPERAQAEEDFRRRQVHFMYLGFTQRLNQRHWRALAQDTDLLRRRVFDHASEPWEGLNTPLQYDLVSLSRGWDKLARPDRDGTAPVCPVSFTQEEADRIDALDDSHRDADGDMERVGGYLGVVSDGWTTNEGFERARDRAAGVREQALASADEDAWLREMSERHWPFDDYDEDE